MAAVFKYTIQGRVRYKNVLNQAERMGVYDQEYKQKG